LPLTSVFSALEAFAVMRYTNWWLTLTPNTCFGLTITLTARNFLPVIFGCLLAQ